MRVPFASFLIRQWFLVTMAIVLSMGILGGIVLPADSLKRWTGWLSPRAITGLVLFLMSATLDGRRLWKAAAVSPSPALLGIFVNVVAAPLLAWGMSRTQSAADFEIGLLIAGSVPCTLATAAVWTRKAGGNDAAALVVTLATNAACFLTTPFWLELTTGREVPIDANEMGLQLLLCAVLPMAFGQLVRLLPRGIDFVARRQRTAGFLAQVLVLLMVFLAALDSGKRIASTGRGPSLAPFLWVWASCAMIHLALLAISLLGSRILRHSPRDAIAAALSGSQKTLPIGLVLATDPRLFAHPDLLGAGQPASFVLFPMILYQTSQLIIDTWLVGRIGLGVQDSRD